MIELFDNLDDAVRWNLSRLHVCGSTLIPSYDWKARVFRELAQRGAVSVEEFLEAGGDGGFLKVTVLPAGRPLTELCRTWVCLVVNA